MFFFCPLPPCQPTQLISTEPNLKVKKKKLFQVERYSEHICGMSLMRRPNCHTNSLWFSLCPLHLSGQNLTFHVHFHACLFILLRRERTVSLYVFGRTSIQDPRLFIYVRADCSLFWCPIVQLSVIFKTLECHLPQIPSLSIPVSFLRLRRRTSH